MEDKTKYDFAEIIPVEDVYVENNPNPANKSNQIVNFVNFNSNVDVSRSVNNESVDSMIDLYNSYNEKYGFEVEFNIKDLVSNYKDIINPKKKELFEIYLSESFDRFRLVFFQRAIITITELMEQVSSPSVLKDPSLSIEYKYGMMTKILELMNQVTEMHSEFKIDDVDIKLKNIDFSESTSGKANISKSKEVLDIMDRLNQVTLKPKNKDEEI